MSDPISVSEVEKVMQGIADPELAEDWDSIGLLLGDPEAKVDKVLLCLDANQKAITTALAIKAQLIVSHHPLPFQPLATLRRDVPGQDRILDIIENKLALIAAHTNLDAAEGGVADTLADRMLTGLTQLVLRRASLTAASRIVSLKEPHSLTFWQDRCQKFLPGAQSRCQGDAKSLARHVVFAPGALSEDVVNAAISERADLIVCGEMKHHLLVLLSDAKVATLEVGHAASEAIVLAPLAQRLKTLLPSIEFAVAPAMPYNESAR